MVLLATSFLNIGFAVAGGGGPAQDPCIATESREVVLRQAATVDRGGNPLPYRIVLNANRCTQNGKVLTSKFLTIVYDTPKLRQKNDGLVIGDSEVWSGKSYRIFSHVRARVFDDQVTREGIRVSLGSSPDTPESSLESVPDSLKADHATLVNLFGNAFPTHSIIGPFDR